MDNEYYDGQDNQDQLASGGFDPRKRPSQDSDAQQRAALMAYQRQLEDYNQAASKEPAQTKPGFWRTLAAAGVGAAGGWNFQRGGMQQGQYAADQIMNGGYRKKQDEYLRMLAAKRQGLETAQHGIGVFGKLDEIKNNAAWRASLAKQHEDDQKTKEQIANDNLDLKRERATQRQDTDLAKRTGGQHLTYESEEALAADPIAQEKLQDSENWKLYKPPSGGAVFVVPTSKYLANQASQAKKTNSAGIVPTFNKIAKSLGYAEMPEEDVTPAQLKFMEGIIHSHMAAKVAGSASGGADERQERRLDAQAERDRVRNENTSSNTVWTAFAGQQAGRDSNYQKLIEKAKYNKDEAEVLRLESQRGQENLESLNNAHLRDAQIRGKTAYTQYKWDDKNKMVPVRVGPSTGAAPSTPAPASKGLAPPSRGAKITEDVARQYKIAANGDANVARQKAANDGWVF